MNENDRIAISQRILKYIPENIKPVHYLMDLFKISNESAYRRIRGDMPFSLEEMICLSKELGFSIDELVDTDNNVVSFRIPEDSLTSRSNAYITDLELYDAHQDAMYRDEVREAIVAVNRMLPSFMTGFDNLFNFSYYKWMHQSGEVPANCNFSEIIIPENVQALKNSINRGRRHNKNSTIILSPYVFYNIIKEIEYYYRRKLLTASERELLKADILGLLFRVEMMMQGEKNKPKMDINYYLSSLAIECISSYVRYDDGEVCYLWVYSLPVITIRNTNACQMQKKWLDSLKKYSTLISHSSELVQSEFFHTQRAYVDNMDNLTL